MLQRMLARGMRASCAADSGSACSDVDTLDGMQRRSKRKAAKKLFLYVEQSDSEGSYHSSEEELKRDLMALKGQFVLCPRWLLSATSYMRDIFLLRVS